MLIGRLLSGNAMLKESRKLRGGGAAAPTTCQRFAVRFVRYSGMQRLSHTGQIIKGPSVPGARYVHKARRATSLTAVFGLHLNPPGTS